MLGSQGLLPDRQGAPVERLGLGVAALGVVEPRQVVEARGHARVTGSKFSCHLKTGRPLLLGLGVIALLIRRQPCAHVAFPGLALGFGMRFQFLYTLQERFGLCRLAVVPVDPSQVVKALDDGRMVRSQSLLADC